MDRTAERLGLDRNAHIYFTRSRLNNQLSTKVKAVFYAKPKESHTTEEETSNEILSFELPKGLSRIKKFGFVTTIPDGTMDIKFESQKFTTCHLRGSLWRNNLVTDETMAERFKMMNHMIANDKKPYEELLFCFDIFNHSLREGDKVVFQFEDKEIKMEHEIRLRVMVEFEFDFETTQE